MHRSREELEAGIDHIAASPPNAGRLEMIVARPAPGKRKVLNDAGLSVLTGLEGDNWAERGVPNPDMQVTLMNVRSLELIAGPRERWPLAGDNLIVDLDLSNDNLPPGSRLEVGGAEIEVTAEPHTGCAAFIERFGRDACVFVNTGPGRAMNLRGINARVIRDGRVAVGDLLRRL